MALLCSLPTIAADRNNSLYLDERVLLRDGVQFASHLAGEPRYIREEGQPPQIKLDGFGLTESESGWLVPARVFWIGIPIGAKVDISEEILERIPWRSPPITDVSVPTERLPVRSVQADPPTWLRNQWVVRIIWTPLVQGPDGAEWIKSIRIHVRFEGARAERGRIAEGDRWENIYFNCLVNYEQARSWRRRPQVRRHSIGDYFSNADTWVRIEVSSTGLYAVTAMDLQVAGVTDLGSIDPQAIRLFTGSGVSLPEQVPVTELPDWLNEVPVRLENMEDGQFDPQDRILFHGLGPDGWYADYGLPNAEHERFRTDEFSNVNTYWLAWSHFSGLPLRWETKDGRDIADPPATTAPHRIHIEENRIWDPRPARIGSSSFHPDPSPAWEKYFWLELHSRRETPKEELSLSVPDPEPETEACITARLWGGSWASGSPEHDDHLARMALGADSVEASWGDLEPKDLSLTIPGLSGEVQTLELSVPRRVEVPWDRSLLAWLEIDYRRRLVARRDSLDFWVETGDDTRSFTATGFVNADSIVILDVTDPFRTISIQPLVEPTSADHRITWSMDPDAARERHLRIYNLAHARRPICTLDRSPPGGYLRERRDPIDYIIISHSSFLHAAERLAEWRRSSSVDGSNPRVALIDVQDIYDEFSAGRQDPTAIRNFLHFAFLNWNGADPAAAPAYVLFLGDASFDFRSYSQTDAVSYVPTYEGYFDRSLQHSSHEPQYCSDDWFVFFDPEPDEALDMAIGRLPANDPHSADAIVDKVITYESGQDPGDWRQRFTLVADDICQGSSHDNLGFAHMRKCEELADSLLPHEFERDRIYLYEYGKECIYSRKPEATEALLTSIDRGTLMIDFVGHGAEGALADERVLEIPDAANMGNMDRLFFLYIASCSSGRFDMAWSGLAEALVQKADGGAVGAFAATTESRAGVDARLNRGFLLALFPNRDPLRAVPLGEAAVIAKLLSSSAGTWRYILLGDPGQCLNLPQLQLKLNVETLRPSGFAAQDTMMRGAEVVLRGDVVDSLGLLQDHYEGEVTYHVYDSEILRSDAVGHDQINYRLTGATILRGRTRVTSGRFSVHFVTPRELLTGDRGNAQIYAYAYSVDRQTAIGSIDGIYIPENTPLREPDGSGPQIILEPQGDPNRLVPGASWTATMTDSSGINITALDPDNSVVVKVDEGARQLFKEDLTDRVTFPVSFSTGVLEFCLPENLPPGTRYRLTLAASDNFNQRSSTSMEFYQSEDGAETFSIDQVYNVPNPMEEITTFLMEMTYEANVSVAIFTASGKRIHMLGPVLLTPTKAAGTGITWDGRDHDGDRLANGVYFYKVTARTRDGEHGSRIERLVVLR